jgi:hypothetical protein
VSCCDSRYESTDSLVLGGAGNNQVHETNV